MVLLALHDPDPILFGACLVAALVSDFLDGVLARRLQVATPNLRRLDSIADSLFYLAAAFAIWRLHPEAIARHWRALLVLGGLELARYAYDFRKFGREASYHMWSSKLWGLFLFAGSFCVLALDRVGLLFALAVYVGIASDLEGLAISVVMPVWRSDVPSLAHALRQRAR
jgi:CDP-diacylglycerol--glycerol-3-phosphate 3-phosphatidyltransferase